MLVSKEALKKGRIRKKRKILRFVCKYINGMGKAKMITLTFRDRDSFIEFVDKEGGIARFLRYLRSLYYERTGGRKDIIWVWVMELQERGIPHYHILLITGQDFYIEFPDVSGQWKWGMTNIRTLRYISKNYLSKYLSKAEQFLISVKKFFGLSRALRTYGYPVKLGKVRLFRYLFRFRQLVEQYIGKKIRALSFMDEEGLHLLGYEVDGVRLNPDAYFWWIDIIRQRIFEENEDYYINEDLIRNEVKEVLGWS